MLFLEFLAIAVTRSLVPELIVQFYGDRVYFVIGVIEQCKGVLAFFACPLFGKLSDIVGRKRCLFVTVAGTTLPVCVLAFTENMWVYVVAQVGRFERRRGGAPRRGRATVWRGREF